MENKIRFEENEAVDPSKDPTNPAGNQAAEPSRTSPPQLQWPTDYRVITQAFGVNPELVAHRGLPGHEGLDIRAPLNSRVYACAEGVVEVVQERLQAREPYGRWIQILHQGGYRTIYGHLSKISVHRGSKVNAGQVIGYAGPTGETAGGHIHISLKLEGATAGGLTHYPNDLMDPTPFLFATPPQNDIATYAWPPGRCLSGTIMDLDGKEPRQNDIGKSSNRPEAIKLNLQTNAEQIARIRKNYRDAFIMSKVHLPMTGAGTAPSGWVAQVRPLLKAHLDAGISYFEVHSAPNLVREGCFTAWQSGDEFARWWLDVVTLLKETYPHGRFGFPGLANGTQVFGQRMDAQIFLEQADEALLLADWIGVHCTWANSGELLDERLGARQLLMRRWYPDKLLFITECGNLNPLADANAKAREHAEFLERAQLTPGVGAVFFRN